MNIQANISAYLSKSALDNHRFRSWNHCHDYFQRLFKQKVATEGERDQLALHLAFYLASWGMYRGSSNLLQKDYKIFSTSIDILLSKDNEKLNGLSYEGVIVNDSIKRILSLSEELSFALWDQLGRSNRPPTPTLVSKILLGTLCCIPALDSYFVAGLRKYRVDCDTFGNRLINNNTLTLINTVFNDNIGQFYEYRGGGYPDAKLIDMAFWQEMNE